MSSLFEQRLYVPDRLHHRFFEPSDAAKERSATLRILIIKLSAGLTLAKQPNVS
jgi:hypothetical protein